MRRKRNYNKHKIDFERLLEDPEISEEFVATLRQQVEEEKKLKKEQKEDEDEELEEEQRSVCRCR